MLKIRKFQIGDEPELRKLFFKTIRTVNIRDYSEAQVNAWAPEEYDQADWRNKMLSIEPFVAILDKKIVAYADLQADGYIKHFFCHADFQGKGLGKTLMQVLHDAALQQGCIRLYSHVSISAKGFFEHFSFKMLKAQHLEIRGQRLKNFVMEKHLVVKRNNNNRI